ncbi:MAG: aminotransferase class V-fold PLP-dependent enzyme, partial [Anaerolineae bacterium]
LAQLEANVVNWFAEIIGYPSTARGVLTSGGSLANFTGLVAARRERLPEDFLHAVIYASDQTHHSVLKAASIAGFPERAVQVVASDEHYRLDMHDLGRRVAADRAAGRRPFLVVASAGTTNSGAVDPLEKVAEFAAAEGLWMHVDAAYGGFFAMTSRGKAALRGLDRADSVVLDPHKSLFLPYGTGCLLVRDGAALRPLLARRAFLVVNGRQHIPLNKPILTIGRRADCDIVLAASSVSRQHAQIRWRHGRFVLFDISSRGRTAVNGIRKQEHILHSGDVIQLSQESLIYAEDWGDDDPDADEPTQPYTPINRQ